MAKVSLTCMCGWSFFIPDSQPGASVQCPSCRQPVAIPGRQQQAKVIQRVGSAGSSGGGMGKTPLIAMGVVAAVLIVVVIVLMSGRSSTPAPTNTDTAGDSNGNWAPKEPEPEEKTSRDTFKAGSRELLNKDEKKPLIKITGKPTVTEKTVDPPPKPGPVIDHRAKLLENIASANMAGIVSAVLRLRRMSKADAALQEKRIVYDQAIGEHYAGMLAGNQRITLPGHIQSGDVVTVFDGKVLDKLGDDKAVSLIESYLRTFQPGKMLKLEFRRGSDQKPVFVIFPPAHEEMKNIVRLLNIELGVAKGVSSRILYDIDAAQIDEIAKRLDALPAGYRLRIPAEDRSRYAKLQKERKGRTEDLTFISTTLPAKISPFEEEVVKINGLITEAEVRVKAALEKQAVVIHLKTGAKLEGYILKETPEKVTFKTLTGITTSQPKSNITKIESGVGPQAEYPDKLKAAAGDVTKLHALMVWCKDKRLPPMTRYVACRILKLDPNHAAAREEAGLPKVSLWR